jgi:hypothetical protein
VQFAGDIGLGPTATALGCRRPGAVAAVDGRVRGYNPASPGGVPERPKGTGCKPVGSAFGGSNPPAPILSRTACGPRDLPHTFTVTSDEARFLLVVEPAGLDDFIRTLSEPADSLTLPPAAVEPPAMDAMMAAAAEHGIEILGPPGIPS